MAINKQVEDERLVNIKRENQKNSADIAVSNLAKQNSQSEQDAAVVGAAVQMLLEEQQAEQLLQLFSQEDREKIAQEAFERVEREASVVSESAAQAQQENPDNNDQPIYQIELDRLDDNFKADLAAIIENISQQFAEADKQIRSEAIEIAQKKHGTKLSTEQQQIIDKEINDGINVGNEHLRHACTELGIRHEMLPPAPQPVIKRDDVITKDKSPVDEPSIDRGVLEPQARKSLREELFETIGQIIDDKYKNNKIVTFDSVCRALPKNFIKDILSEAFEKCIRLDPQRYKVSSDISKFTYSKTLEKKGAIIAFGMINEAITRYHYKLAKDSLLGIKETGARNDDDAPSVRR